MKIRICMIPVLMVFLMLGLSAGAQENDKR
jgi:riboflavin transporter FmnP